MRVVFDTVIFVRSLLNPHSRWGQLIFNHADQYILVVSGLVAREILEVLRRPEITRKIRFVAEKDMTRVLDLLSQAEVVEIAAIPPVSRDPKVDNFLTTAKVGNADYLISEDRDLLDLDEYEGTKIVDAVTFLHSFEEGKQH